MVSITLNSPSPSAISPPYAISLNTTTTTKHITTTTTDKCNNDKNNDATSSNHYDPMNTKKCEETLKELKSRIMKNNNNITPTTKKYNLRVHSIHHDYSLELLTQYYNDHMIPFFPLEDERDALEDWIECLDPIITNNNNNVITPDEKKQEGQPLMDVLLLLLSEEEEEDNDNDKTSATTRTKEKRDDENCAKEGVVERKKKQPIIVAAVAFEYYQDVGCGLISYVTVNKAYHRRGIMKRLHPLAIHALQQLHSYSQTFYNRYHYYPSNANNQIVPAIDNNNSSATMIRAIFAETNTVDASDASVEEIHCRHKALYGLGYRLIHFPYVQPPLAINQESFDDVMLLIYQGDQFQNCKIPTSIPYDYVVSFYKSVFGYIPTIQQQQDAEEGKKEDIIPKQLYEQHWYYNLCTWYNQCNPNSSIQSDLPWKDITNKYRDQYKLIKK
mmetsp:Transcript_25911/g.29631  ORF Transcript_25911/g.29631 Transcript_25911/m.29631 type:complete len:443 (-) Transcript_25911:295-1623(-)